MKLLVTGSNVVVSFGEFVHATAGHTIVDTEELTVAQITDIATVNKVEITAKRKADIIEQLKGFLAEHNTEVTEMSDEQKFEEVVVAGFAKKLSDDDIKENLYKAGCPFKDIDDIFKDVIKVKALRLTPKERNAKASDFLEGYVPDGVENHLGKVSALQDHLECSTTQAGASMRKWAKDNSIELPKVPTKSDSKVDPGFRGILKVIANWVLAQEVQPTFEQIQAFTKENTPLTKGGTDSSKGYANTINNAMIFANTMYAPAEEVVEEVEMEEAA